MSSIDERKLETILQLLIMLGEKIDPKTTKKICDNHGFWEDYNAEGGNSISN